MKRRSILRGVCQVVLTTAVFVLLESCAKETTTGPPPPSQSIRDYIVGLTYDGDQLLSVEQTGAADRQLTPGTPVTVDTPLPGIGDKVCIDTPYNLKQNFEKVAILRPTTGIAFPGALVKANRSLRNGVPELISIPRAPVTFSVNLPGIGAAGRKTVSNPTNSSMQVAIDEALEAWNAGGGRDGYVNPANSSLEVTTAYKNTQTALDLGVAVEWATGSASGALSVNTTAQTSVVTGLFMQSFYTITIDQPTSPEAVFDSTVTLGQVQQQITAAGPPAYVSSVSYGRIIMVRLETDGTYSSTHIEGAFKYAGGSLNVDVNLKSTYEEILTNSRFTFLAIGGNAAEAVKNLDPQNPQGSIMAAIVGDQGLNAVYSRNNPGVPIAYEVRYLQDNSLAKMGFTTDYTTTECSFKRDQVRITLAYLQSHPYPNWCGNVVVGWQLWYDWKIQTEGVPSDSVGISEPNAVNVKANDPWQINWYPIPDLNLERREGRSASNMVTATVGAKWYFPYEHIRKTGTWTAGIIWTPSGGWTLTSTSPHTFHFGDMAFGEQCSIDLHFSIALQ